jgi:type IV fimbrial biogenesis protein FimT
MCRKRNIRAYGFTLIELMTTLGVVAVILAFAAPNFREFILNSRMTGSANDLLTSLQFARSEAIKRQRPVAVCPSTDPSATPPVCRADAVWSDPGTQTGLVVWEDTNGDAAPGAGETVIAPRDVLGSSLTVRSNFIAVVYQASGFPNFSDLAVSPPARVVLICDSRTNQRIGTNYRKRIVAISNTGRAAILKDVDAVERLGGQAFVGDALTCPDN